MRTYLIVRGSYAMKRTPPTPIKADSIKAGIAARIEQLQLTSPELTRRLVSYGVEYANANRLAKDATEQRREPSGNNRQLLAKALEVSSLEDLYEPPGKAAARRAVLTGMTQAVTADDASILACISDLLHDPASRPYIAMAAHILKSLTA